jgi:nicotinate phosphoribosyltransferase
MKNLASTGSLALFTDLYQLTMAYGYWKNRVHERETVFHVAFRTPPFGGGYAVACGIQAAIDYVSEFRFDEDDIAYLATLEGNDRKPLFAREFLDYLANLEMTVDIDAVAEGEVVFGHEPLMRVQGPVLQCQLIETALLTLINFQTLIATKAARVCLAARGEPVLEFGARRAQGIDGALSAARAAYIGGCSATSNVLAGKIWGIPVKGTHAHSWVMLFEDELEAFTAYARAMPNNCVFLVDTYNTLEGVEHAVQVGQWLRPLGHKLAGIRLDSGDLAYLSIEARRILDDAGFNDVPIVASNDLDEHVITSLKEQGAKIGVWGVGTRLVTGDGQGALGGVYKLSAVQDEDGTWLPRVKLSEQTAKTSTPGRHQIRRFYHEGEPIGDAIFDLDHEPEKWTIVHPVDVARRKHLDADTPFTELLQPALRAGLRVSEAPPLAEVRAQAAENLAGFYSGVKRLVNPHAYPAGLEESLHERKIALILAARDRPPHNSQ